MAFLVVVVFVLLRLVSPLNWPEIVNARRLSLHMTGAVKVFKFPQEKKVK